MLLLAFTSPDWCCSTNTGVCYIPFLWAVLLTWYHLQNMSGDSSHTKSAKRERCSLPRISIGTLQICTINTAAGGFPSQGEVMESSFMSQPLKFGYHPQNWIALGIAPTDRMPREKDTAGLNLPWATNHLHTNTVARCFPSQKKALSSFFRSPPHTTVFSPSLAMTACIRKFNARD